MLCDILDEESDLSSHSSYSSDYPLPSTAAGESTQERHQHQSSSRKRKRVRPKFFLEEEDISNESKKALARWRKKRQKKTERLQSSADVIPSKIAGEISSYSDEKITISDVFYRSFNVERDEIESDFDMIDYEDFDERLIGGSEELQTNAAMKASIDELFVNRETGISITVKYVILALEDEFEIKLSNTEIDFVRKHLGNLVLGRVCPYALERQTSSSSSLMTRHYEDIKNSTNALSLTPKGKSGIEDEIEVSSVLLSSKIADTENVFDDDDEYTHNDELHTTMGNKNINICFKKDNERKKQSKKADTTIEAEKGWQQISSPKVATKEDEDETDIKWLENLDCLADIAYKTASGKLQTVGMEAAIAFYHRCFKEYYSKVNEKMLDLIRSRCMRLKSAFTALRNKIIGFWCGFARLLLDIASMIISRRLRSFLSTRSVFIDMSDAQALELQVVLFDFSLMILSQASRCSLVGNHAFLGISYSKIIQFGAEWLPTESFSDKTFHRYYQAAINVCTGNSQEGINNLMMEPYFDQQVIDTLDDFCIIDITATKSLFEIAGNCLLRDKVLFNDRGSKMLLEKEIKLLVFLQDESKGIPKSRASRNSDFSKILSYFPIFKSDSDKDLLLRKINHASDDQHSFENRKSNKPNGFYCFDIEEIRQDKTSISIPKAKPVVYLDYRSTRHQLMAQKKILHLEDSSEKSSGDKVICNDVQFYCKWCPLLQVFPSKDLLDDHKSNCTHKKLTSSKNNYKSFGNKKYPPDWRITSFDPNGGPLLSRDEDLIDVLGYSVEIFEATEVNKENPQYKISSPYFHGQMGIQCQYCSCDNIKKDYNNDKSRCTAVFPQSLENIPQSMWYLSLIHLDTCPNQPQFVRKWHKTFRQRFGFKNCAAITEYWNKKAKDVGVVPSTDKDRGLIICPSSSENR